MHSMHGSYTEITGTIEKVPSKRLTIESLGKLLLCSHIVVGVIALVTFAVSRYFFYPEENLIHITLALQGFSYAYSLDALEFMVASPFLGILAGIATGVACWLPTALGMVIWSRFKSMPVEYII